MKKINLDQGEDTALEQFVGSGANYVKVIKKIFDFYLDDMKNIENIDPKGNVGLQTTSRQQAFTQLKNIRDTIFPEFSEKTPATPGGKPEISKWR